MMKKLMLLVTLIFVASLSLHAQGPSTSVVGFITAATTSATCVGAAAPSGGAVDQPVNGATGAVGVSVTGTWSATLNIQYSVDHGKQWTAVGSTFSANQQSVVTTTGYSDVCVFASAYVSGTAVVTFSTSLSGAAGTGASAGQVQGTAASGSASVGNPVLVGGTATPGGNAETLLVGANGNIAISPSNSTAATFETTYPTGFVAATASGSGGGGSVLGVEVFGVDPCQSSGVPKSSVAVSITTATTTSLVAASGSTKIYVCGGSLTISEVVTTANTFELEYGTGAACVTTQQVQTGTYGAGGVTAGAPIVVTIPEFQPSAASSALCAVTTIGATGSFQGVITYVQQ